MGTHDTSSRFTPSAEEFAVLTQVIRDVARYGRLSADDAQDFGQTVHVKLLERNYRLFTTFSGACSLRTFLTVTIRRMLLDWRRTRYGKWRVSMGARRLGPTAIALETLMSRDGHTLDAAIEVLRARPDAPTEQALRELADQLPRRHQRRREVAAETLDLHAGLDFDDPIERSEHDRVERSRRRWVASALRKLPASDRLLLDLRYRQQQQVPAIARRLQLEPKAVYRRCDKLLRSVRQSLEATD
jgi:RNA polymerase sigma factor (sigma-70 family)